MCLRSLYILLIFFLSTSQGDNLDISKPGRKLVSKGILVIQNITKSDAGRKIKKVLKYERRSFYMFYARILSF